MSCHHVGSSQWSTPLSATNVFIVQSSITSLRCFVSYIGWKLQNGSSTVSSPFWLSMLTPSMYLMIDELFQPADLGIRLDLAIRSVSVIHGCQPSTIELCRLLLLVPRTLCLTISRPHHLCQFSVAAWRPVSSGVHSLDFCSAYEVTLSLLLTFMPQVFPTGWRNLYHKSAVKKQRMKMQDWIYRHSISRVDNAGVENAALL